MGNKCKTAKLLILLLLILSIPFGTSAVVFGADDIEDNSPLVTATFFDSDLRESMKEIALQTGVNIVLDANVKGIITLELKNVPLEKALRMMVIGEGFSVRKIDDFYVIGLADPKNPAFPGLCDSMIYYFKHIDVESAKALLPVLYEPYVKFDAKKDSANVVAPPDLLNRIITDFKLMDIERKQVKIKALVTEIENEVLKEHGMDLLNIDFNATGIGKRIVDLNIGAGVISGEGDADFGHFSAAIRALVIEKKATIHADPVLIVTEGKSGDLFVGEKRTLILYSQGTNTTTTSTESVEAGTTLKVTPKIIGDQIELTVSQKISDFSNGTPDEITVKSREFNSVVRFLPGQTIMVAGLTEKNTRTNTLKTPILGDIPIVGWLFKQRSTLKGDSELLVFLTAEVNNE